MAIYKKPIKVIFSSLNSVIRNVIFSPLILLCFYSCNYYEPKNEEEFGYWVVGEWTGESNYMGEDGHWKKYVFEKDGRYKLFTATIKEKYAGNSKLTESVNNVIEADNKKEKWEVLSHSFNGKWKVGKEKFSDSDEEYYFVKLKENGLGDDLYDQYRTNPKFILRKGVLVVNYGKTNEYLLSKGDHSPFRE